MNILNRVRRTRTQGKNSRTDAKSAELGQRLRKRKVTEKPGTIMDRQSRS